MSSKKRRRVIYGGLAVLVAVIALAGWGTVELLRPNHPYSGSWQADAGGRKLLEVHTDGMGVSLGPSDSSQVEVKADGGYDNDAPQVAVKRSGQGLSVVGSCPSGGCSVQLHIKLPADLAVKADTGGPQISVSDLKGPLDLRTGSGAIDADNTSGALTLHTGAGAVTLAGSRSPSASVTTGDGAVDAGFVSAPTNVNIATGNGAVDLRVPHGSRYYIDATSSNSTPDVKLPVDRNASHQITVKTRSGGIQVH
ncbi:hypothetical protein GCM10022403_042580 [Streptomyces coacervatus]|uniref:DUF4097 domain-containing protein n=1 Tax=Streptomyces coacervatus TaxID=647381 RepID=A0ABP7I1V8_9ACTN|nr:DUF4097 family beta strand repeat-containing protein [Streptomyces coacervatus]MDF2267159.1 DUF4097 family beta strand repeat-containing protein [Streptomyces coacervatus]